MDIIGLQCYGTFEEITEHFRSAGVEVILLDASRVFGRDHIRSAMIHAERAFDHGTNRSKTLITEFLIYMAGERQISKALEAMWPKGKDMVAVFPNGMEGSVEHINANRCDTLIDGTEDKARLLGLDKKGSNISYEDMVLEMVAMVDIMKI